MNMHTHIYTHMLTTHTNTDGTVALKRDIRNV